MHRSIRNQTSLFEDEVGECKDFCFFLKALGAKLSVLEMEDHKALSWTGGMIQTDRFQNENKTGEKLNF